MHPQSPGCIDGYTTLPPFMPGGRDWQLSVWIMSHCSQQLYLTPGSVQLNVNAQLRSRTYLRGQGRGSGSRSGSVTTHIRQSQGQQRRGCLREQVA